MRETDEGFEREDALVCADVLGGFGVSSDHVREHVTDVTGDATSGDLESAIQCALADPEHPTAFVRRTVAAAPRGVDAPVRFWTTAPETQLGDVFAALDWTFDVKSANGRSLSVDDEQPYRLRVEDPDGRARSTTFSFPDTALGEDNYPALVHAINAELLYGLSCRFVQLSAGTDRWRFALVEPDELDRLRERFGERLTVFERPLLAANQPEAYVPDAGDDGAVPVPSWARDDDERSWRGRRLTADAFDADHVGGLDHLNERDDASDGAGGASADAGDGDGGIGTDAGDGDGGDPSGDGVGTGGDPDETAAVIEFVEADEGDTDGAVDDDDDETARDGSTPSVSGVTASGGASDVVRDADAEADTGDDLDDWSIGGTVDATTRSAAADATASGSSSGDASTDDGDAISASGFDWGNDDAGSDGADAGLAGGNGAGTDESVVTAGALRDGNQSDDEPGDSEPNDGNQSDDEPSDGGFFDADAAASFDAGAETNRVEPDSFGVDAAEQTEDDQFAAVGAALAAPADISVGGLLDDDEFLPHLPQTEPEQTRIEFDEEFDPSAGAGTPERETDDGFVWVNESSGVDEQRTSALD